jgi:hypothetical protein
MFRKPNKPTINKNKTTNFLSVNVLSNLPHSYSSAGLGATRLGLHLNSHAEKETRYIRTSAFT